LRSPGALGQYDKAKRRPQPIDGSSLCSRPTPSSRRIDSGKKGKGVKDHTIIDNDSSLPSAELTPATGPTPLPRRPAEAVVIMGHSSADPGFAGARFVETAAASASGHGFPPVVGAASSFRSQHLALAGKTDAMAGFVPRIAAAIPRDPHGGDGLRFESRPRGGLQCHLWRLRRPDGEVHTACYGST
jgi:hypothetical protein